MPKKARTKMIGYKVFGGVFKIFNNKPISAIFKITKKMLPINILLTNVQIISGCFSNNRGPGCKPNITTAPNMTAVVPEPGTPIVSNGISEPTEAALFEASGAATPSMAPLPNFLLFLEICFSVA